MAATVSTTALIPWPRPLHHAIETLKVRSQRFIASHRDSRAMRALHRLAVLIEEGYENAEWDIHANGELGLIQRLAAADFVTVFDVGAHVGDWSLAALSYWKRAYVHAFEVAPLTFERLDAHLAQSGLSSRATLNCQGLAEAAGVHEMFYYPEHPHLTCDAPRHPLPATPFEGAFSSGDAYMREHQIDTVDFVKIDVEGAEHLVLKGFRQAVEAQRVQCIQFEYGAFSIQTRVLLTDYYNLLAPDYWVGKLFPSGVEFRDYDWTMENFRFSNFVCVSRRRPDLKALAEGHRGS